MTAESAMSTKLAIAVSKRKHPLSPLSSWRGSESRSAPAEAWPGALHHKAGTCQQCCSNDEGWPSAITDLGRSLATLP